ncbi:MAG: PAS domain S-box protein [Flavobacteriales bacterium]|nr:PAS domain S-box protein [Flavobacteriales bacterium]
MMAFIGVITTIIFASVFWFFWTDGVELFYDRVAVLVFGLFCLVSTHVFKSQKTIYRIGNALFYVFTFQVLLSNALNHFDNDYFITLILTIQAVTIAFRNGKQALAYLLFVMAIMGVAIIGDSEIPIFKKGFVVASVVMSGGMLYTIVEAKGAFQRSMKLRQKILSTIVTKTETAVFLTDFEGNIIDGNPRAEKLFELEVDKVRGENFSEFRVAELTREKAKNKYKNLVFLLFGTLVTCHQQDIEVRLQFVYKSPNTFLCFSILPVEKAGDVRQRSKADAR